MLLILTQYILSRLLILIIIYKINVVIKIFSKVLKKSQKFLFDLYAFLLILL